MEPLGTDAHLREAFPRLMTRWDVARLLRVDSKDLHYWCYRNGARYREFQLPKKSGGYRTISAPEGGIRLVQRKLCQILNAIYVPRHSVHGFVPIKGRGILTNAEPHVKQRWVLNVDLSDFFDSIHFGRVRGVFERFGAGPDAADLMARICCFRGRLPQGVPTSPVVTNLVCRSLDRALQAFAKTHRCAVTRYADDITLSTGRAGFDDAVVSVKHDEGRRVAEIGHGLRFLIESHNFSVNESKVRLSGTLDRQEVTGLIVNRKKNVPREYVRNVRAMIHAVERYGVGEAERVFHDRFSRSRRPDLPAADFLRALRGRLEFIRMVKGDHDATFVSLWNRAARFHQWLTPRIVDLSHVEQALWIVESEVATQGVSIRRHGTAFVLKDVGLVTAGHCVGERMRIWHPTRPAERFPARIRALCTASDLCVLEPPPRDRLPALDRGDAGTVAEGVEIGTAGFPDEPVKVAQLEGRVSMIRLRFGHRNLFPSFETRKGMSGAPLLDARLRVVGVVLYGPDRSPSGEEDRVPSSAVAIDLIDELPKFTGSSPALLT